MTLETPSPLLVTPHVRTPVARARRWIPVLGVGLSILWLGVSLLARLDAVTSLLVAAALVSTLHLARCRPARALLARDREGLAGTRAGRAGEVGGFLMVTLFLLVRYEPTWIDDAWIATGTVAVLALTQLLVRRIVVALMVTALLVALTTWSVAPRPGVGRTGDAELLSRLDVVRSTGGLDGFGDLAVAEIDLDAVRPVRTANLGTASAQTPMEVGSLTKAMTGLVVADSIRRGELRLDAPVSTYLPRLRGSAAGGVTLRELVTHHAGYGEFGASAYRAAVWSPVLGRNWLGTDLDRMLAEVRTQTLATRGTYAYSTLGAATAGQAAAGAAGMTYPQLMQVRLFGPLGMAHTAIPTDRPLVHGGRSRTGLPQQAWLLDGYAPGGGAVSTTGDLARLATALLEGTAPGMSALTPVATTDIGSGEGGGGGGGRIGYFWQVSAPGDGPVITWHNGATAGYASYLGLDRARRTAVVVLSDVLDPCATDLGAALLRR